MPHAWENTMPVRRFAIVAAAVVALSQPAAAMSERWSRCVPLRKAPSYLPEGPVIAALMELYTDQRHRILRIRRLRVMPFPLPRWPRAPPGVGRPAYPASPAD